MAEKQYRALADGDWRTSADGPAANVKAGDVVILTNEQLASNPTNFVAIESDEPAPKPTRRAKK